MEMSMARVTADASETELENDYGKMVDSLEVTCAKCGYTVEVFGNHQQSAKRGGVMLAEGCPRGERNFYVVYGVDFDRDDDEAEVDADYD
jgi:hypothetical protein